MKHLLVIAFLLIAASTQAQSYYVPANSSFSQPQEQENETAIVALYEYSYGNFRKVGACKIEVKRTYYSTKVYMTRIRMHNVWKDLPYKMPAFPYSDGNIYKCNTPITYYFELPEHL